MKIHQNPFRFDEQCVPKKLIFFFFLLKNHCFLAKMPKYCPKIDFVFREIAKFTSKFLFRVSRNFAKFQKISQNTKLNIFAATLPHTYLIDRKIGRATFVTVRQGRIVGGQPPDWCVLCKEIGYPLHPLVLVPYPIPHPPHPPLP